MLSSVSFCKVVLLVLALTLAFAWAAHAQTPADEQYGSPTKTPSGDRADSSNEESASGELTSAVSPSEEPTSAEPGSGDSGNEGSELWGFGLRLLVAVGGVLASLYLLFRVMPGLSLPLQRRAVSFLILTGLLLAAAQILYAFWNVSSLGAPLDLRSLVAEAAIVVCLVAVGFLLRRSELEEVGPLRRSADLDPLTVLSNQAFFRRAALRRVAQAGRHGLPLSLAMIDVDEFKEYNDLFGHEAGNAVLVRVAGVLRRSARADDLVARYGGEEFMMLLNSGQEDAEEALERIRLQIEVRCSPDEQIRRQVTVSIGVASLSGRTLEELIEAADESMYQAKRAGKNRVIGTEDVA